jgi:hypothetical protein
MKSRSKQFVESEPVKVVDRQDLRTGKIGNGNTSRKLSIVMWNVNGIRSILNKNAMNPVLKEFKPDFICINETKVN